VVIQTLTRQKILPWLTVLRFGATARGVLPFLLGGVIAWSRGYNVNIPVLVLSSITTFFIMLTTFLINEYYDFESDLKNEEWHRFSGGSRVLPLGLILKNRTLIAAHIFLVLALVMGLFMYFYYHTGVFTIPLGFLAVCIGYGYTARPVKLAYRGFGEIAILFSCGWLAVNLGYYFQTGQFSYIATLASIPSALSVFLVILINEFPDIKSDSLSGKKNLAVRLGRERAGILYTTVLILSYVSIVVIAFFGVPVISAFLSVVLVPFVIMIVLTVSKKGLYGRNILEGLSLKTVLFDHLITIIYAVAFIIAGLNRYSIGIGLWALVIAFVLTFALEGLGIICSRIVLEGSN
jgi:1,4-dihydroxy-2-naphthoate octaprenyltransferase